MFTERVAIDLSQYSNLKKSVIGYELEVITLFDLDSFEGSLALQVTR